jgi:KDO2-lipid IV(A) lauroyltransferase
MNLLFRILSRLPLGGLHLLGWMLGWIAFIAASGYRKNFLHNAALAGIQSGARWAAVGEAGKLVAELPRLWIGAPVAIHWDGAACIEEALASDRGILFLTPHMGCFEVTAQAYAQRFGQPLQRPITVLFRPPRKEWLSKLVQKSRARAALLTAPTTLAGVKQMMKALKFRHSVGLLPDQVPPNHQGVWSPFFGQPAYTMTLSARLAMACNARVLVAWGERLSWGRGYVIHVQALDLVQDMDLAGWVGQVNRAMEQLILKNPAQYLWGYDRYRQPRDEFALAGLPANGPAP